MLAGSQRVGVAAHGDPGSGSTVGIRIGRSALIYGHTLPALTALNETFQRAWTQARKLPPLVDTSYDSRVRKASLAYVVDLYNQGRATALHATPANGRGYLTIPVGALAV